ncbi:MAG: peptidoglycan-binding protein [Ruminococcus sp.]|jgi:peptidoglycan hydrolase-like protein with peptidoglycan-binding domain|nr:peptidoglycan-binding protein [Ruminococcus sp.]
MPVTAGERKNDIQEIQNYLRLISFQNADIPTILPTGIYDSQTREAVTRFQEAAGLPATGEIDKATWDEIVAEYKQVEAYLSAVGSISPFPSRQLQLKQGDRSTTIFMLQSLIATLAMHYINIPRITVDGYFGPDTEVAVKVLQKVVGLPETGIVDDKTWDCMAKVYNVLAYLEAVVALGGEDAEKLLQTSAPAAVG